MLDQLEMGQTVTVAVPTEAQAWEVMHLEAGYLVRAPAFVPQGQDRAAVMRGCLAANGAPALGEAQARLVFRDPEVVLEALLPTGSGEGELQGLLPLLQALREAAASAEHQAADEAEQQAQDDRLAGDTSVQMVTLLQALDRLAQGDAELSANLSTDLAQGEGLFEGEDGSWVVAVGEGRDEATLSLTAGVCVLPDGEEAAELIGAALALGSVQAMGPNFRLGCDPACTLLMVSTEFQPHTGSVDELKAAIGGLLLLSERTASRLPIVLSAWAEGGGEQGHGLAGAAGASGSRSPAGPEAPPSKDDSLAFYARTSA